MGAILPFEMVAGVDIRSDARRSASTRVLERGRAGRQQPRLSVIVASTADDAVLDDRLAVIAPVCSRLGAELIVARAGSARRVAQYGRRIGIRVVVAPVSTSEGELRAIGAAEATGDILVLLQDARELPANWAEALEPRDLVR